VTAQPSAFYRLALWAGDTDGALQSGDELRLPMTRPRTVVAVFSARLTPPHHVPEWWLAGYGWTQDFEAAAESDSDGDGLAAWQEWKAGTDPTNALSVLKVIGFDWSNISCRAWFGRGAPRKPSGSNGRQAGRSLGGDTHQSAPDPRSRTS
jgi:hypothetical protein